VKIVHDYLVSQGVLASNIRVSRFRDMLQVDMSASVAAKALKTEFALFRSVFKRNVVLPRITQPYFLPREVADVVSIVDDIMRFPALRSSLRSYDAELKRNADDEFTSCGSKCNGFTTPAVLQARYGYPAVKSVATGNSMSVAEFQGEYYDTTTLKTFSTACNVSARVDTTIGGNNATSCADGSCAESLLDIEYIEAVANPIPLTVIYATRYSLLSWITRVLAMDSPPLVHSVSYETDEAQQTSTDYMLSVNEQLMMAGSLGLSIFFASGDDGVWGRTGDGEVFSPGFPSSSPYVTSVGGTNFATRSTIGKELLGVAGVVASPILLLGHLGKQVQ
jgi:tripeptidyl-peptidase-1